MKRTFETSLQEKLNQLKKAKTPEPIRSDGAGTLDLGPRNLKRDEENPDILVPPATDFGLMPNLKFSFSDAHMTLKTGGWSREITKRELPINNTLAIVNMNLLPGGREMRLHQPSEWGFVLIGDAQITAVDEQGRTFIADCHPGEGWIFPANIPHSIQALHEGCEFVMIFDQSDYSENNTFSISELFSHLPMDVLSANFGVNEAEFKNIPDKEVYIDNPRSIENQQADSSYGNIPCFFKHELINIKPILCSGGSMRILDHENFHSKTTFAVALVEIEPGGMREIHWHSNNDELQYYIQGKARMTVFQPGPKARTFNYQAGDVGYVPVGNFHYVQNIGDVPVIFLEIFNSKHFINISLSQWLATMPKEIIKSSLNLSTEFYDSLSKANQPVVKYPGYTTPNAHYTPQNIRYFKDFDYQIKQSSQTKKEHPED